MIKKVSVNDLRIGMYIHDLNCGWLDHGFLRNRFRIRSASHIENIRRLGVHEVYIDTDKGYDLPDAPSEGEVVEALERELDKVAAEGQDCLQPETLAQERVKAQRIHSEVLQLISRLMQDARLGLPIQIDQIRVTIAELVSSIFRNQNALLALGRIRHADRYTFEHSVNVSVLMVAFARELGLDPEVIEVIGIGALLHDIGKTKTPEAILNKPGRLTDEEFAIMRSHVVHSREILARIPGFPDVALAVAAEHHERLDGTGYPEGKIGEAISFYGRMASIVDVYDAITSDRVYHRGMEPHQALRKLLEWSRYHLDPQLVRHFIRCVGVYPVGSLVRLESQRLAVVLENKRKGVQEPIVRVVMDARWRRFLPVEDLDLALKIRGAKDRILGVEDPGHWGIDCDEILRLPV
ncbi:HD-GYP domain-containing protein [Caldichromatium japonicum]|uniref:HD-GYP domain-containing protein n=1 Tax=Caldichromatium japonicum TaxID=2699430 RepID=A0A6G7VGC4_9GAMM|nr:HD-GYP domain-containing protein [Caldichromatium japonicum]QIK38898.1 HD-GYP domain-containing protein [Caldichromatium japonicum]